MEFLETIIKKTFQSIFSYAKGMKDIYMCVYLGGVRRLKRGSLAEGWGTGLGLGSAEGDKRK